MSELPTVSLPKQRPTTPVWGLWPVVGLFVAFWAIASITSDGFLEDDAYMHYLYSRFAWSQPAYFTDFWARPVCTALYALAAPWFGMWGCRLTSLLLVLALLWLTQRTAERLDIHPHVSALFLLAQPKLFLHSLSAMTELPFALLLIGAFLSYIERRWWVFALLAGMLPLARPEGFGFLLLGTVALAAHRSLLPLPLLMLPLMAWSFAGWIAWGAPPNESPWTWLIHRWPWSASSTYGRGSGFQFLALMPVLVGAGWPFILIASVAFSRRYKSSHPSSLLFLVPLLMFLVHSVLWATGKMASYGEIRYLLIVSPFWAILAAAGWERSRLKPSPAVLAMVGLLVVFGLKTAVARSTAETRSAREVTNWYLADSTLQAERPRVIAAHPAVYALLDRKPGEWNPANLQSPAADAVVIWDPKCGPFNADHRLIADVAGLEALGWSVHRRFGEWVVLLAAPAD